MIKEIEEAIIKTSWIYPTYQQKPYLDGGLFGYNLAIDKACEWLENNLLQDSTGYYKTIIEQFKQSLKRE